MRLSFNWLKEYVDIKLTPEELAEKLTMATAQVEEVKYLGKGMDKVVAGEIMEITKHPNADKLQVAKVKIGKDKVLQIVCGAPNIAIGQKVPVAMVGAVLPGNFEIKKSAIRGVESEGMMCAEDEMGIGEDHSGICILPPDTKVGEKVKKILGLDDAVLEIENKSLTHRPDLFNHIGIAREISAITGAKLKTPEPAGPLKIAKGLSVQNSEIDLCPRYMAVAMGDVQIKDSPQWLKNRLKAVGIRSINNVVDITNYILMEYGQPLHAFDADKLKKKEGPHIEIRRAENKEKILALDGKEYELDREMLVIADIQNPIAIAGIMGGEKTGIDFSTKNIIIESANFDQASIRRTSWRLGVGSDSSLRFEKGLPPILAEQGLLRAIQLVSELAGGKLITKVVDIKGSKAEKALKMAKIKLDTDKARAVIGEEISDKKIKSILERLNFGVKDNFEITVPLFRNDVRIEEDLIEEIARIYGYDNIEPRPIVSEFRPVKSNQELLWIKKIKGVLAGFGFDEVYNYSFYGENWIKKFGLDKESHYELINPLNPEQKFLRVSLLPHLYHTAEKNSSRFESVKIFEVGHIYLPPADKDSENPQEKAIVGGVLIDKRKERFEKGAELSRLKGVAGSVLLKMGIENEKLSYRISASPPIFREYSVKVLDVLIDQEEVVGRLEATDYNRLDKKSPLVECFELDLEKLIRFSQEVKIYRPIPLYPEMERDFSFAVDKSVQYGEIAKVTKEIDSLVAEIDYLSLYESEQLGTDKKSLAFRVIFQSPERTLISEEVDKICEKIIKKIKEKFNAEIR